MLEYSNSFFGAYNQTDHTFVIRFQQAEPIETDGKDGSSHPDTIINEIASIVTDASTAKQLAEFILSNSSDS